MEQRVCERDETHIETRITDYSGPDYTLKPDKTKLRFEWTYGQEPTPQTITFKSTGRDNILAITDAVDENSYVSSSPEGMTLTIVPQGIMTDCEGTMSFALTASTANGETIDITELDMALTCNVKKTDKKFTLTVEEGVATTGTLVGNNYMLDTNWGNKLQVRGGVAIRLEPDDEWRKDFLHWEVVEDASNLLRDEYDLERAGGWGPSSSPTYGNRWTYMSPNDVTVRAIYKKNEPTMAFSETEVTASMEMPFIEPRLRTTPGGLKVTYNSSDESVAKANATTGEIIFRGAGITTITATFAGNAHYSPATATYTLIAPQDFIDGIQTLSGSTKGEGMYNLAGQRVGEKYKGIVIENGRKMLKK